MSNPNNCATCDHKRNPQGGWCYAFRDEPNDVCMQHTGRKKPIGDILAARHAAHTDYGNRHRPSRLPNHAERDRLDGRTG